MAEKNELEISIGDIDEELRELTSKTFCLNVINSRCGVSESVILKRFYDEVYPLLENLYFRTRGKGILGGYIKE